MALKGVGSFIGNKIDAFLNGGGKSTSGGGDVDEDALVSGVLNLELSQSSVASSMGSNSDAIPSPRRGEGGARKRTKSAKAGGGGGGGRGGRRTQAPERRVDENGEDGQPGHLLDLTLTFEGPRRTVLMDITPQKRPLAGGAAADPNVVVISSDDDDASVGDEKPKPKGEEGGTPEGWRRPASLTALLCVARLVQVQAPPSHRSGRSVRCPRRRSLQRAVPAAPRQARRAGSSGSAWAAGLTTGKWCC